MAKRTVWIAGLLALLMSGHAVAQSLAIEGVWGNEAGCKVAKGGENLTDQKIILKAGSIEGHESVCDFLQVLTARDGASLVTALCQGEGAYSRRDFIVGPADPGAPTRVVFFDTGEFWTEVAPCG